MRIQYTVVHFCMLEIFHNEHLKEKKPKEIKAHRLWDNGGKFQVKMCNEKLKLLGGGEKDKQG